MRKTYEDMLQAWTHPTGFDSDANFVGTKPQGYCIYSRNRDSSILEQVNFSEILKELGGESETVEVVRHRHWACGWIEYLIVSREAPTDLLDRCVEICKALKDYPVYSDTAYGDAQCEAIYDFWDQMSLKERIGWCVGAGESFLKARHNSPSDRIFDRLLDVLF